MKKEIERLQEQYKDVLKSEIVLQMEKSDCYDNRSPRCYRIYARLINDEMICEYGYCKNKDMIVKRFEQKLMEVR